MDQSLNAIHFTTVLVHMQSVILYIDIQNFNLSCNLAMLDYIILFYIQQHIRTIILLYSRAHGALKVRQERISNSGKYYAKHKNYTSLCTMQDTTLMNTDCTCFSTTYFIIILWSVFYFKTLEYSCKAQQHTSTINFDVTYYSVFGIIITIFTIILYPQFLRRGLFPFTVFVTQYSYLRWLKQMAKTCSIIEQKLIYKIYTAVLLST